MSVMNTLSYMCLIKTGTVLCLSLQVTLSPGSVVDLSCGAARSFQSGRLKHISVQLALSRAETSQRNRADEQVYTHKHTQI